MYNKNKNFNKKIKFSVDPKNKTASIGFNMSFNKGGLVKTYAKGGGVRKARMGDYE